MLNMLIGDERHQCHKSAFFDGRRHHSLMFGAGTAPATRFDLGVAGDVLPQHLGVFKIDVVDLFLTEIAVLFGGKIVPGESGWFAWFFSESHISWLMVTSEKLKMENLKLFFWIPGLNPRTSLKFVIL